MWFLAPTVTLCEQQFGVFQAALPAYSIKMLSGQDNTEHWSDQAIWDSVLENVRIIISTHAVLLDALTHGFVKMSKLALIIFDEGRPGPSIVTVFPSLILPQPTTVHSSILPTRSWPTSTSLFFWRVVRFGDQEF